MIVCLPVRRTDFPISKSWKYAAMDIHKRAVRALLKRTGGTREPDRITRHAMYARLRKTVPRRMDWRVFCRSRGHASLSSAWTLPLAK
jgi:hypothetical protein